jgi:hypothetical protein
MSPDVRLPPPSETTRNSGGTRAREATSKSTSGGASASRRSSGKANGGTAANASSVARGATARSATAMSHASTKNTTSAKPTGRQPLSAVPTGDATCRFCFEKLSAVVNLPEKWCACCRGPHLRGAKPHPRLTITQRALANAGPVSAFATAYANSSLPAEKNSGDFGGAPQIRWRQPRWPGPASDFAVATWLPVFVEGCRVTMEPQRMIAIEGTKQIIQAHDYYTILPLIPQLVPHLRAALNTSNPPAVAAALEIVSLLLTEFDGAVDVLLECDGFRRLLPTPNILSNCTVKVRVGYRTKIVGGEQKRLDVIIHETLSLMAEKGGARGLRLIKSYVPTFDPGRPVLGVDDGWGRRKSAGR